MKKIGLVLLDIFLYSVTFIVWAGPTLYKIGMLIHDNLMQKIITKTDAK